MAEADYYSPHPRVVLGRPLVLAGEMGCGIPAIGRGIAARTGLRFCELDRVIEHAAGRSLARIDAPAARRATEARADGALATVLARRPCGVVVLDRAWPAGSCELLEDEALLIEIRRSRAGEEGEPEASERRALLASAHLIVEAEALHPHRVVSNLLASIDGLGEAGRR